MFNVECCKVNEIWNLKYFRRMLLDGASWWLWGRLPEKRAPFFLGGCDLHRKDGTVVILLSFLCNFDNLIVKLHQEKRSYPDEGWIIIGRFKVGSVSGMSAALESFKKSIKIDHEYDVRPLIKSYNCY